MKRKTPALLLIVCMLLALSTYPPQAIHANTGGDTKSLLDNLFNQGNSSKEEEIEDDQSDAEDGRSLAQRVVEDYYSQMLSKWEAEGYEDAQSYESVIHPKQIALSNKNVELLPVAESQGYDEEVLLWNDLTKEIDFMVNVPADGLYHIQIDYLTLPGKITPVERSIQINDEFQFFESRRLVFPRRWKDESEEFQRDQLGNEVFSKQVERQEWQTIDFMDASYLHDEPLRFYLKKGSNNIKLLHVREAMLVGRVTISSPKHLPSYDQYIQQHGETGTNLKVLQAYEAEKPIYKSDSYIQPMAGGDVNVTPQRRSLITMNTLGGDSWKHGGQSVTWEIEVPETGYYEIAFKFHQYFKANMPVFRKFMIDGEVPFQEMSAYAFPHTKDWQNEVFSDKDGKPFQFYLTEGKHTVTLVVNPSPYQRVIQMVREVMEDLNVLNLEIKMATGNTQDVYRDWDILEQMPNITEQLNELARKLRGEYEYMRELSGKKPDEARNLIISAEQLEKLAAAPASIPYKFGQLSQGQGSVTQKLGDVLLTMPQQQIEMDKFYVYANEKLPRAKASLWQKISATVSNFFLSFTKDYSQISPADEDSVQIWVNRPRQYVMLMQQMANQLFTPETGIKVSFSLMPNEQKLILANASGTSPDVAMGVGEKFPYELALRGALVDFTQFDNVDKIVDRFAPGALLPFIFDEGLYALPETQNFWVLYYRKDILDALELEVPQTWSEVLQTLPDLQRYGMNFYVPLAEAGAMKSFNLTTPFIYQQGGELFAEDGTKTAVDSEAALEGFKLMTNIFNVYNMPLQVPNFYNHFRDGNLPIGISNYSTYVELTTAAPELAGWWKIAPYPGIKGEDGEITRWAPGTGPGIIAFNNSDKQQEAWDFIQWWTSAEIQAEFGNLIETIYGPAYRWNSANLEAFAQLPWPQEDLDVILDQWKWLKDVPHIPGDYMLDRELSNAWNKVVFDGENQRKTIEDAVVLANREIMKKMEEFGYVKDGKFVKTLKVPKIDDVIKKRGEAE